MLRSPPRMVLLFLLLGCAAVRPAPATGSEPAAKGAPEQLPAWLRPIVRTQMVRQWDYVNELRWTAASLEFERTRELAQKIVQETHCGRMTEGDAAIEAVIPSRYLDLQEKLRERAYRLSLVTSSGNTRLVANAYHAMVEVCTRCHSAYRPGPPLELPLISSLADAGP
jgi:hypothetical protein